MNVPMLRTSAGIASLQDVQPSMPALWRSDYLAIANPTYVHFRVQDAKAGSTSRVGRVRSFGIGNPQISKRRNGPWPGAIFGVREPFPKETPLSWDEVMFAWESGLL